jgi:predicted amidohydrolase
MTTLDAALVQTAAATDSGTQRARLASWADQLLAGPDPRPGLVVLPEAVMHDFGATDHDLASVSEPLDGPFVSAVAAQARRLQAVVVAGMFERNDADTRPYNTLVALGPDGSLLGVSRKVHLYDSFGYRESERLQAGAVEPMVVHAGPLTLGLMTCYDLRFPEYARLLVDAGADTLVVPAAWVRGPLKEDHWSTLLRARAIENTAYVLAAAQTGPSYCGRSQAVDPSGVVVAGAGDGEAVVRARLDADRVAAVRTHNPALSHRRIPIG